MRIIAGEGSMALKEEGWAWQGVAKCVIDRETRDFPGSGLGRGGIRGEEASKVSISMLEQNSCINQGGKGNNVGTESLY